MRLIDADILKDELREKVLVYEEWADREKSRGRQRLSDNFSGAASGLCQAITILSCQPTIKEHTIEERKTGKWVLDEERSKECVEHIYICSACHNNEAWGETERTRYCSYCGAKMENDHE